MRFRVTVFVGILHILWGIMLFVFPETDKITALAGLRDMFPVRGQLALVLITVAVFAILGVLRDQVGVFELLSGIPQQIALMISCATILRSVSSGIYPDGYQALSSAFIFADQLIIIMLTLGQTIAILEPIWSKRWT